MEEERVFTVDPCSDALLCVEEPSQDVPAAQTGINKIEHLLMEERDKRVTMEKVVAEIWLKATK